MIVNFDWCKNVNIPLKVSSLKDSELKIAVSIGLQRQFIKNRQSAQKICKDKQNSINLSVLFDRIIIFNDVDFIWRLEYITFVLFFRFFFF